MRSLAYCLPALPFAGFTPPKTYAAWPVWKDSTTQEVKFTPLPKKKAVKLYHCARDFDRRTRKAGHHGGAVGPTALQVLHTLIFDFLDFATGQLDPGYAAIARKANVCVRSVANAIKRLRGLGILNWLRRCREERTEDGGFALKQETNAYAILPPSQWRGYDEPQEPPAPERGTWGDHPPLPDVVTQATIERSAGASLKGMIGILDTDPTDPLAAVLARLGRAVQEKEVREARLGETRSAAEAVTGRVRRDAETP